MNPLPAKWTLRTLGDVTEVNPRRPSSLRELPDDHSVTFVEMASVDQVSGTITAPATRPFSEVRKGFTYFEEDDVIFAKITPCMQNGKSAIARGLSNGLGMGSTEFHVFRPNRSEVLPEWIWYFVRQPGLLREAMNHFRGAVGQQRVPASYMATREIPVPPLHEQRRVVARLNEAMERVAELRCLREDTRAKADLIEAAVFADFVEALGDNAVKVPMVRLGDVLCETKYGSSSKANTQGNGIPMLRMGNIRDGHLVTNDLKHIELSRKDLDKYTLRAGDILINRTNSLEQVGKAATFNLEGGPWVYASYLVRLRADTALALPEYLTSVINSRIGRFYVYRTARRAIGMVNINAKEIKAMPIPLPSLAEQGSVVDRMTDARTACVRLLSRLQGEETDQLPAAILRKAFAGEL